MRTDEETLPGVRLINAIKRRLGIEVEQTYYGLSSKEEADELYDDAPKAITPTNPNESAAPKKYRFNETIKSAPLETDSGQQGSSFFSKLIVWSIVIIVGTILGTIIGFAFMGSSVLLADAFQLDPHVAAILITAGLLIYFFPSFVAQQRKHDTSPRFSSSTYFSD
jgi:hypothetical protein